MSRIPNLFRIFLGVALAFAAAAPAVAQIAPPTACPSGICPQPRPRFAPAVVRLANERSSARAWGSGTIVEIQNGRGVVPSCAHLFSDESGTVTVWFADGRKSRGDLVALDREHDLSVIVADVPDGIQAVAICPSHPGVFNSQGELVGVVWGTDGRRTMATYCGRVRAFLGAVRKRIRQRLCPRGSDVEGRGNSPPRADRDAGTGLREGLAALGSRLDERERTARADRRTLSERLADVAAMLNQIKDRFANGSSATAGTHVLPGGSRVLRGGSPADWLLPIVLGALGISTPPTLLIVGLKVAGWIAWRRIRRRSGRRRDSDEASDGRTLGRQRNDDYAKQLNDLYEHSGGRSTAQDTTLGREYDRLLEEAQRTNSSHDIRTFAAKAREAARRAFERIHADRPVPVARE